MHFLQHPMTQYKVIISQTKPIGIGFTTGKGFKKYDHGQNIGGGLEQALTVKHPAVQFLMCIGVTVAVI